MKHEKIYILYASYCGEPDTVYSLHRTESGAEKQKKYLEEYTKINGAEDAFSYFISERELYE